MRPVGDLVGLAVPGQQGVTLLILKNQQGLTARGAVDPLASHLHTPSLGFVAQVEQTMEIAALEETLPDVGHAAFHLGLVFGMTHPGRIGDEAAVL